MTLTPEQKQAVSSWVAAGDNLSAVQKKLITEFKISMTYMDVRFLVDDLNLALKDQAPKIDASDVTKAQPASPGADADVKDEPPFPGEDEIPPGEDSPESADFDEAVPPSGLENNVVVTIDKVTLLPGALASGTVTFSDGVTGKWIVDNYGRPGFTEISKPGYRPSAGDAQAFMKELSTALQKRGY